MHRHLTRRGFLAGSAALSVGGVALSAMPGLTLAQDAAGRTNHALIVAVTKYPDLPPKASLVGPNNDAALVRAFLTTSSPVQFDAENVHVLADDIENATPPTRMAIRGALDDLAGRVKSSDLVYLHFSGHGAQQPAMNPSIEPDGLDEIFLPRDTGMWTDRTKGVPNALIDKELRDHLQAIRDKGAFIWAVFDCCHSGTMTRAASMVDGDVTERKIDFTDLGITDADMAEAIAGSEGASRGMGGTEPRKSALSIAPTGAEAITEGGMVAFFAAQTVETTPEMPLPAGAENPTKLGLFTYTVFSKIAENPAMTYRQLGQAVLQSYSGNNRTRPTPLFEGDLDKPVFGTTDADRLAQWPIKSENGSLEIPAGQLHRLSQGAKLAILPSPGSTLDQAIGYVEVLSATNLTSTLLPVAHEGLPARAAGDIPPGAYARLTELSIGFELVIARPGGGEAFAEEIDILNKVLDRIIEEKKAPVNLRLVDANQAADLKLAVMSEMDVGIMIADQGGDDVASRASLGTEPRVWLLPPSAELSLDEGRRAPSLPIDADNLDAMADQLTENLVLIFRATNVSRLAAASDFRNEEFTVNFKIKRQEAAATEALTPGTVPIVHPDDQVHLEARNGSSKPVDINVLYIGSDYSISHMYAERLHGGSEVDIPLLAFTPSSYGIERMVAVLSEAVPQSPVEDLSFLEQIGVRQATRAAGVGAASFGDLMRDIAGAPATRGAARLGEQAEGAKGAVMIFPMENLPRA